MQSMKRQIKQIKNQLKSTDYLLSGLEPFLRSYEYGDPLFVPWLKSVLSPRWFDEKIHPCHLSVFLLDDFFFLNKKVVFLLMESLRPSKTWHKKLQLKMGM